MLEQVVDISGYLVTQWELSTATLRSWVWLLATILRQLELVVGATKSAREKGQRQGKPKGINDIYGGVNGCMHMPIERRVS